MAVREAGMVGVQVATLAKDAAQGPGLFRPESAIKNLHIKNLRSPRHRP